MKTNTQEGENPAPLTKRCSQCGELKPLEGFHVRRDSKDGRRANCKGCAKKYREANREYRKEHKRKYHEANREYRNEYSRKYYEANREHYRKYREANKERLKECNRKYYEENKERLKEYKRKHYEENKEYRKEYARKYYEANPEVRRAIRRKRRARKLSAGHAPYTTQDIIDRDGLTCSWCGGDIDLGVAYPDPMSKSIDHVIPISKGGPDKLENVQLLHLTCNIQKGDRVYEDGDREANLKAGGEDGNG